MVYQGITVKGFPPSFFSEDKTTLEAKQIKSKTVLYKREKKIGKFPCKCKLVNKQSMTARNTGKCTCSHVTQCLCSQQSKLECLSIGSFESQPNCDFLEIGRSGKNIVYRCLKTKEYE